MTPANWMPEIEYQKMINVLTEVSQERKRQEAKWGQQNHEPIKYVAILNEEVGEVNQEICENHFHQMNANSTHLRTELIQVAAVAVAMIECIDRLEAFASVRLELKLIEGNIETLERELCRSDLWNDDLEKMAFQINLHRQIDELKLQCVRLQM